MDIAREFLSATINAFEANKRLADRAVEQVPDDKLHAALDANTNSIAVIMKHVAGNLTSRWTDFLTTDGEKPGRDRDCEFVDSFGSRAEILEFWERGWACLLATLKNLKPEDFDHRKRLLLQPHFREAAKMINEITCTVLEAEGCPKEQMPTVEQTQAWLIKQHDAKLAAGGDKPEAAGPLASRG
jgi:hypothetical protein